MSKRIILIYFVSNIFFPVFARVNLTEAQQRDMDSIIVFCRQSTKNDAGFASCKQIFEKLICNVLPQENRVNELRKKCLAALAERSMQNTCAENPVLSFTVPVYNRERTIRDALDSIYSQNLDIPFEVIVVDDASTDGTVSILEEYKKNHSNFFYLRNKENMRAPATRNRAIAYARGTYICNVDSDDILSPNCIRPMLKGMQDNQCDAAYFDQLYFFEGNNRNKIQSKSTSTGDVIIDIYNILRAPLGICAGNRLFTKKAWLGVGGYLEKRGHDSWSFSFLLAANGFKAYIHPGSWYWHRTWAEEGNMFRKDQKEKVNDISPKQVFYEHDFLFDKSSVDKLVKTKIADGDFIAEAGKILKLRNNNFLDNIIHDYYCETSEVYHEAINYYQKAIDTRVCDDVRVLLKKAYLQFMVKNFDGVQITLTG